MIINVIDIINKQLAGWHSEEVLYGIAESILRVQGTTITKMPGIVKPDGEIIYVGIDDIRSLIAYHKLNSITTTQSTNGTGDSFGDIKNVFNASLFVYWDANKINAGADEVLMITQARIPLLISGLENMKNVVMKLSSANINSHQIYTQEYVFEESVPLPQNKRIVQINYNIEITFKPECFRQCPECS